MLTEDATCDSEKILNQAKSLFARKGYAGTSLREICKTSDVNRQQMLEVFEDKRTLYLACLNKATEIFRHLLSEYQERAKTASDRLTAVLKVMADLYQEDRSVYGVLHGGMMSKRPEEYMIVIRFRDELQDVIQTALEEGIATGEFRKVDPASTAAVMLAAAISIQHWASFPPSKQVFKDYRPEELIRVAADWMIGLLVPETETADGAEDTDLRALPAGNSDEAR